MAEPIAQTQAGRPSTGPLRPIEPKPLSERILPPIGLGLVGLGALAMLIDVWPLLVAKLSGLQWLGGGMIHLGALGVVVDVCRRRETAPQQMALQIRMLVMCMLVSWSFDLSLLTKVAH